MDGSGLMVELNEKVELYKMEEWTGLVLVVEVELMMKKG